MKTIVINASPRKDWNTAEIMKSAEQGAKSVGAETEYIDLYDLTFTGCRSCLACKINGAERCKCYWNDDLSPVIDKILSADTLLIGSPIYLSEPTSQYRALLERLIFSILSYDGDWNYFKGKVNVGIYYTMNAPREYYESSMKNSLATSESFYGMLNGEVKVQAVCDTLQVNDYSKYSMGAFSEEAKKEHREKQFDTDLKDAFDMGAELSK